VNKAIFSGKNALVLVKPALQRTVYGVHGEISLSALKLAEVDSKQEAE
jgi:hypothetical protein